MITNDASANQNVSQEKKKTFLYEYLGGGPEKMFRLEILDEILMSRLGKNKDENKFIYLMQTYRRLENHLYTKTSSNPIITQE